MVAGRGEIMSMMNGAFEMLTTMMMDDRRRCVACDLCRRTYGSGSIRCQVLCRQLGC